MRVLNDLSRLPPQSSVFVDSNIITYFLLKHTDFYETCKRFLTRIERGEVSAFINHIVMSEVYFSYIRAKLSEDLDLHPSAIISKVKDDPGLLSRVDLSPVDLLFQMENLAVANPSQGSVGPLIQLSHLLPNDALHLSSMLSKNITDIASNDRDFERIRNIKVWRP